MRPLRYFEITLNEWDESLNLIYDARNKDESLLIHEICNFQRRFVTQERFGNQPPRLAAASLNFSRCNLDDEAVRFVRYDVSETTICQNVWVFAVESAFFNAKISRIFVLFQMKSCVCFRVLKKGGVFSQMFFLQICCISEGVDKAPEFPLQPRYHGADHETLSVPNLGLGETGRFLFLLGEDFWVEIRDVFLLGGFFVNQKK